jgi:hypothetical protein
VRFLLCLGIQPTICPAHRPDKNWYVERLHRTYKDECLTFASTRHARASARGHRTVPNALQHRATPESDSHVGMCHRVSPSRHCPRSLRSLSR